MNINDQVARFWKETIPDWIKTVTDEEHGGVFDRLVPGDLPDHFGPKTTLVQARVLFTLAHVELAGHGNAAVREGALSSYGLLMDHLRHPDGGWRKAISRDGSPSGDGADSTRDCYDHTFVVLATAIWGRVDPSATGDIDRAWHDVETLFSQSGGAFIEDDCNPSSLPRRQNPHMHMFEACLCAWESTGQDIWRARAEEILDIFERHLFDPETGTVREFLSHDLGPLEGPQGAIREPGHNYEWVWLLNRYTKLGGTRRIDAARDSLLAFADTHGRARSGPMAGAVFDEFGPDGTIISETHLLWPQTEAIKAYLSEYERTGDNERLESARQMARLIFTHYIGQGTRFWINQRDAKARVVWSDTLSRLPYHIAVALTEGERLGAWRAPCLAPVRSC